VAQSGCGYPQATLGMQTQGKRGRIYFQIKPENSAQEGEAWAQGFCQ
jgi:hypothetical protein